MEELIVIKVMGGLGNQLQQYALYRKMQMLGKEARLDLSWFEERNQDQVLAQRKLELRYFKDLPMEVCTKRERDSLLGGEDIRGKLRRKLMPQSVRIFRESGMYHPEIFGFSDRYLEGFWACEKYYADILPELRKEIVFPNDNNEINNQIIKKIKGEMSVSLHVRRGDYLDPENAALFGGICTEAYYEAAVRYIRKRCPDAHFYVFSDDSGYVKEKYRGSDYTVVDWNTGENSFWDIRLMSCCKHNICANSTFSFWGARLNSNPDKIMIRPAKHKNSQQASIEQMHRLWEGWTIVDERGKVG